MAFFQSFDDQTATIHYLGRDPIKKDCKKGKWGITFGLLKLFKKRTPNETPHSDIISYKGRFRRVL